MHRMSRLVMPSQISKSIRENFGIVTEFIVEVDARRLGGKLHQQKY